MLPDPMLACTICKASLLQLMSATFVMPVCRIMKLVICMAWPHSVRSAARGYSTGFLPPCARGRSTRHLTCGQIRCVRHSRRGPVGASAAHERAQRGCAAALSCTSRRRPNTVSARPACSGTAARRCPLKRLCSLFMVSTDSSLLFTESASVADSSPQPMKVSKSAYIATAGL